jgi:hypothetical protein
MQVYKKFTNRPINLKWSSGTGGQEVEFHEIESNFFHEIESLIFHVIESL